MLAGPAEVSHGGNFLDLSWAGGQVQEGGDAALPLVKKAIVRGDYGEFNLCFTRLESTGSFGELIIKGAGIPVLKPPIRGASQWMKFGTRRAQNRPDFFIRYPRTSLGEDIEKNPLSGA
jgi:hypothetical protein